MAKRFLKLAAVAGVVALMAGCAAPTKNVDYAAFKASKPRSIVVLPPLNESPDVGATYGMLSQVTVPLA
ncbi:GNA1162 family protein, partial [uncultured Ralstonia sp.]